MSRDWGNLMGMKAPYLCHPERAVSCLAREGTEALVLDIPCPIWYNMELETYKNNNERVTIHGCFRSYKFQEKYT